MLLTTATKEPSVIPQAVLRSRRLRASFSFSMRSFSATLRLINSISTALKPPILSKRLFFLKLIACSNLEPFKSSSLALDLSFVRIFCHLLVSLARKFLRIMASFSCSIQSFNLSQEESKISWAISTVADCLTLSLTSNFSELKSSALLTNKFSSIKVCRVLLTKSLTNSRRFARLLTVLLPDSVLTILTNLVNICLAANCCS